MHPDLQRAKGGLEVVEAFLTNDVGYEDVTVGRDWNPDGSFVSPGGTLLVGKHLDVSFTLETDSDDFMVVSYSRSARAGVEASFTNLEDALRWLILRERTGIAADRGRPRTAKLWDSAVMSPVRSEMVGRSCVVTWASEGTERRATFNTPFAERDAAAFASQREETLPSIRNRVVAIVDGAVSAPKSL